MHKVLLFVEDVAHEVLLSALLQRVASDQDVSIAVDIRTARGGRGRVLSALAIYLREIERGQQAVPDLLVVGTDGNCKGFLTRKQEIDEKTAGHSVPVICAIPDPHIERWLLLDAAAFKAVLGKGCQAPDQKCERDRYKKLLIDAIREAGNRPLLGGIEHAEDIVREMNLPNVERQDDSFGKFLKAVRDKFKEWRNI
jgi:hypothetical protein